MKKIKIIDSLFDSPTIDFSQHILIPNNERIIFSGRFGTGKTTFLSQWFFTSQNKVENFDKRFNVIHIFPVNYSVAQNEDIFKYIKHDILMEMLRLGIRVEEIDLSYLQTLPFFLKENAFEIGATLLGMIPRIGKDFAESAKGIKKLIDRYTKYHEQKAKRVSTANEFLDYLNRVQQKEGSIYENDVITRLIVQELQKAKGEKGSKENILIIDDLDRIDPEHIFRILNVFAAHFDRRQDSLPNKFGFDKVILVCDVENIRNIFKAKFGVKVDFNGYIDKFYSQRVFEFNPYNNISSVAHNFIFQKMKFSPMQGIRNLGDLYTRFEYLDRILSHLILNQELDLRNILKLEHTSINEMSSIVLLSTKITEKKIIDLVFALKILCFIKGDYRSLLDAIEKSNNWEIWTTNNIIDNYCGLFLYLLTIAQHKGNSQRGEYTYIGAKFHFESDTFAVRKYVGTGAGYADIDKTDINFLKTLFIHTIHFLHSEGALQ